ncbi:MAG TPA: hypothetical protein DGG94_16595 [Micromonosporaceae bacterium]|nr:hypothetical protein [Micromonosporaceae bacterium]HCU51390.1 hypothetical protein [Micromonosporaceae bacterium]
MSRKTGRPSRPVARVVTRGLDRWQLLRLFSGLVVAMVIGIGVGLEIAGPSSSEASVASIRQAEAQRDVAQIGELTTMARNTKQLLTAVVSGLAATQPATDAQLAGWQQIVRQETQRYAVTVSGATATNVARGAFRGAVDMLSVAVDAYALARTMAPGQQQALLDVAARQRTLAVTTWSVAATQLDQLNVDAGNGHQHVYLTDRPDGGAMTSDGTPEGTKP